ncbi:MAG: hypothetical protein GF317_22310 [Candidatus Lokiarchaeota archaeon]|nr:hypothetical protein [Candidatus Lokiarchaeota archaeon]MBD3202195.1 hypothetical protein [Candidatus Lokiarchaeota archaeon]
MVTESFSKNIKQDFFPIISNKNILGILLFGSYAKDQKTNRSDIDICIVAPEEQSADLLSSIFQEINTSMKKYDVRLFQELPL